jgi:hypothetical protein
MAASALTEDVEARRNMGTINHLENISTTNNEWNGGTWDQPSEAEKK